MMPDTTDAEASRGHFTITRDIINRGEDRSEEERKRLIGSKPGPRQTFRLLDDDGEVYFHGVLCADPDTSTGFEPLDWAAACYGCTEIQYRENGTWRTL